jgi:hypothetical protein
MESDPRKSLRSRLWHWRLGSRIGPLAIASAAEEKVARPGELIVLATIQAEAGYLTKAAAIVDRAIAADRAAFDRTRFVGLTAGLHALTPEKFRQYGSEVQAAEAFRQNYGTFRSLVEANAGSICVVGNAPAEVGRGLGNKIDSHALVIRFNNYSMEPAYWSDYGRKTDVWVRGSHYLNILRRTEERYAHTVIADDMYWRTPNGQDNLIDGMLFKRRIEDAPRRLLTDLVLELGARPSSGIIILAWLKQILGTLDGVSVFGFALSDQLKGLRHYFADRRVSGLEHNWLGERALFERLMSASHTPRPVETGSVLPD